MVLDTPRFHEAVAAAVSSLRSLGHDLWGYDEEEEFEVWGPNYAEPAPPGLLITFQSEEPTDVKWSSAGRVH